MLVGVTLCRDLISSLINIASSRDVPFHQPQPLQCLHHGATFVPHRSLILSSQPHKVTICCRHAMASVRDIKVTDALLMLCLTVCYEMSLTLLKLRHYGSCIKICGAPFMSIFSVFSVMVGWIGEMLFMLFFSYIAVLRTEHSWV